MIFDVFYADRKSEFAVRWERLVELAGARCSAYCPMAATIIDGKRVRLRLLGDTWVVA